MYSEHELSPCILSEKGWTYTLCESIYRQTSKGKTIDEQLLPGHQRVEAGKAFDL